MIGDRPDRLAEGVELRGLDGLRAEGHPHRRRDADGRCAAHPEFLDGDADRFVIAAIHELDLVRKPALVQNPDDAVLPLNCWDQLSHPYFVHLT